ncbi:outer membrane protein transport protein, partial [Aliivibrio sifiae]
MNTPFSRTLLATSLLFISSASTAGGFQVNEHSATGLGRAFAGEAVIADNASVLSRNAAAMMMFDKDAFSMGMTMVKPDVSVKDGNYNRLEADIDLSVNKGSGFLPIPSFDASGHAVIQSQSIKNVDNVAPVAVVPSFYYIHPIN